MKYVLYHSSITNDRSALQQLREHAVHGEILDEYYDDLSNTEERPQQKEALRKCKETGATLLIPDLSVIENVEKAEREKIRVKRLN